MRHTPTGHLITTIYQKNDNYVNIGTEIVCHCIEHFFTETSEVSKTQML